MTTVYILRSLADAKSHYVGSTNNLKQRLTEHDSGECFYTAQHKPWKVIVSIDFTDEKKAKAFEKYLKSGSGRAFAKKHF